MISRFLGRNKKTLALLHFEGNFDDSSKFRQKTISYAARCSEPIGAALPAFKQNLVLSKGGYVGINDIDLGSLNTWTIDFRWNKNGNYDQYLFFTYGFSNPEKRGMKLLLGANKSINLQIWGINGQQLLLQTDGPDWASNPSWHIAIVKNGLNYKLFINGLLKKQMDWNDSMISSNTFYIGYDPSSPLTPLNSYLDEFRISNAARWDTDFTPNVEPYKAD